MIAYDNNLQSYCVLTKFFSLLLRDRTVGLWLAQKGISPGNGKNRSDYVMLLPFWCKSATKDKTVYDIIIKQNT